MECIFCKIIKGEIPSYKLYEDDVFIAILDIRPVHFGHSLLIPKKHFVNIYDTPQDIGEKIYPVLTKLSIAIKKATNCDGLNVIQNNEEAGGQEVFHSHIHIIPRFKNDGIKFSHIHKSYENNEEMKKMAENIKNNI
jgi:histidine triad (HIT) family protein